ncbi:PLP-dependent aminotransferase family protein [Vibrio sp. B1Z05]|uniref:MocR-like pyridoxine biosynthesis transcription factor PdxR n=1 Tax=Vibrio sp. B1Z05 TaxID=2654980 RepID=UPI00128D4042|nr:PLP-dependent aminotransferase family protein [Vibrio sp. B1Z05]MPW35081.1 aminotransferase class I/II-fold pyridoxal phosphate-dependent enzyme [Vibrio sp. B1Z05]
MAINYSCFIEFDSKRSLQEQVREYLVKAILEGIFSVDEALPSCRKLSSQLKVSRNTVSLVYEGLADDGYLISKPRSGYYLSEKYRFRQQEVEDELDHYEADNPVSAPNWASKLKISTDRFPRIVKPSHWSCYQYPFIYGQPSINDFPLAQWRESTRKVIADPNDHGWLCDKVDKDVELLVEQIRTRVLPQRGIHAKSDEILITIGSQNALYLVSQLLMDKGSRVGVENPGYKEANNIFGLAGAQLHPHTVDEEGLVLNQLSAMCDYFYVTPSHQAPTGVTMSKQRRNALLQQARKNDAIIIEDDYDSDSNSEWAPLPALKAHDKDNRVIYVSSFSKVLAPGLRLGYIVAPEELIYELRTLRRLMYRHPPSRVQMEMAHFISQGYYDSFLRRFKENTRQRWQTINDAVEHYLPDCARLAKNHYSNALWLETPNQMSSQRLASRALSGGVLIETGYSHFMDHKQSHPETNTFFRLGFHAIDKALITPGIEQLAKVIRN